jgi:hypothetical protein
MMGFLLYLNSFLFACLRKYFALLFSSSVKFQTEALPVIKKLVGAHNYKSINNMSIHAFNK